MPENTKPAVGWIGLGDQGLPMGVAIAEAGYSLHVWARRPASLDALAGTSHVRHGDAKDLAAACDIVGLCVSTDDDVLQIVTGGLLDGARPGSVVVNHGTGTPGNAVRLTEACAPFGIDVLDASVSGGRPAAAAPGADDAGRRAGARAAGWLGSLPVAFSAEFDVQRAQVPPAEIV